MAFSHKPQHLTSNLLENNTAPSAFNAIDTLSGFNACRKRACLRHKAKTSATSPSAGHSSAQAADVEDDLDLGDPGYEGPAAKATLKALEWGRLCEHIAQFASTYAGRQAVLSLKVNTFVTSLKLNLA